MTTHSQLRVALYARYSSDLQSSSSAQDQISLLSRMAQVRNVLVVATFIDEGLSGATLQTRPQALALLDRARQGEFDVVMCEALDRLSRDQEDTARIFKHLTFAGVVLETLSEGRISELHVGLSGTMNQLFLAELGRKTRRGLMARVQAGFSGGGRCYGYSIRDRGVLAVDPLQAVIVRRIFNDFATGHSASTICADLNGEGILAPRGSLWRNTTLLGSPRVGDGILSQELYIGQRVFNRRRFRKHPETGRRSSLVNPSTEWLRQPIPELRIVDDALWSRVQSRRAQVGGARVDQRRPKRMLSGLLFCGSCGCAMTLGGKRYGCPQHRERRACSNKRAISARRVELAVLDELLARLGVTGLGPAIPARETESHEELARLEERLLRLRLLFVEGDITRDQLRTDALSLQACRKQLLSRLLAAKRSSERMEAMMQTVCEARAELVGHGAVIRISAIRELVQRVTFLPGASRGGFELKVDGPPAGSA